MKDRDRPPKEPTAAEARVLQAARDKRAAEWAAIRLRVLGPSSTAPIPAPEVTP